MELKIYEPNYIHIHRWRYTLTYIKQNYSLLLEDLLFSSFAGSQHTRSHPWQGREGANLTGKVDQVFRCFEKRNPWNPGHEIPPMTSSWGENLTGKADQVFRDSEKLPPALTLKMISVFLMLASIDYSLISVTQAEGLPWSLSK